MIQHLSELEHHWGQAGVHSYAYLCTGHVGGEETVKLLY